MGIIVTLILGGFAGWIASKILRRDESMGVIANIVVGIIGAFVANLLIAPLLGTEAVLDQFTLSGFLMALLGATILLAIVNLFTRRNIR